jgi:leucyl aminopeptidase
MLECYIRETDAKKAVPLIFLTEEKFSVWCEKQSEFTQNWIAVQQFSAKPDTWCQLPSSEGKIEQIVIGCRHEDDVFYTGCLSTQLPKGIYRLEKFHPLAALAWGMGAYQFTPYKVSSRKISQLVLPAEHEDIIPHLNAIYLVRDLINTPAEEMGPEDLANCAEKLAHKSGGEFTQIIGDDLLIHHYPAIHTVGRASHKAPRLIDLRWGKKNAPKVTLIGKGVCFDSGGLDLKSAQGMALMKKDMAGGAHVLGLAYLIMHHKLPVRLRVLIPAVENAVSGNAYRPGDVIKTRHGLSVEIGNTDAEGRLVLADALSEASREEPVLILDIATLTGAAKIALGSALPALFTDDDELAQTLFSIGQKIQDPVWRMPLHTPYRKLLDSPIADINNMGKEGYGGAITAALFLKEFVSPKTVWAHFDIMAWNVTSSPGHPEGGEAMGLRTIFTYLENRFKQ